MVMSSSAALILSKCCLKMASWIRLLICYRFAAANLSKKSNGPEYAKAVESLEQGDKLRVDFLKACLRKMGLQVNETENSVPSLSLLHLTSVLPTEIDRWLDTLSDIIVKDEDGRETIKGANDTFVLERPASTYSVGKLKDVIASVLPESIAPTASGSADDKENREPVPISNSEESEEGIVLDYDKVVKRIFVHNDAQPSARETPYFKIGRAHV